MFTNPIGVFISYSHQDRFPAEVLAARLSKVGYHTWVDFKGIVGGDVWRQSIEEALNRSKAFLVLLTPEAIRSEYVSYEINRAIENECAIIPLMIRSCELPSPLEQYQYIDFGRGVEECFDDLHRALLFAVTRSVSSNKLEDTTTPANTLTPPVEVIRLERPDGTMRTESLFYIERQGDQILQRELMNEGVTIVIKAPRQMGKSSLLVRGGKKALDAGFQVVFLDFQSIEASLLRDPLQFYKEFCFSIQDELGLDADIEGLWSSGMSNTRLCTLFMQRSILEMLNGPFLLIIDEVDRMFDCDFRSDFFGMLRSWHNRRQATNAWRFLNMALVISTEPYMLIENSAQSPFNVGEVITLEDFSLANVEDLNHRHGQPLNAEEVSALYSLVGGHPYLVRQSLYRVATKQVNTQELLQTATQDNSIFSDHLRRYLSYFNDQPALKPWMLDIIAGKNDIPNEIYDKLHGAGLVKLVNGMIVSRCRLYAEFFRQKLTL